MQGLDVEIKDSCGNTSLNNVSTFGFIEVVKYLFETCHANIEAKDGNGNAPIIDAAGNGHIEVVTMSYSISILCYASMSFEIFMSCLIYKLKSKINIILS